MDSPESIKTICDLKNLDVWLEAELVTLSETHVQDVLRLITTDINKWIRWPQRGAILWQGCVRKDYHKYPDEIKSLAKQAKVTLDTRANGPAVASFVIAGGIRPQRYGSHNAWSVHHIYDGKFPYVAKKDTLHAVKHGDHFTNSAGLVAVHPIADAICSELPCIAWYLRAKAFQQFKYDPDGVFN